MHFSLQDMVRNTLAEAEQREKTAAAADGEMCPECKNAKGSCTCPPKKQGPPAQASDGSSDSSSPERNEDTLEEKTSSVFVEKLASAVEFLNGSLFKSAAGVGAGEGVTALPTNYGSPTPGKQTEETGQAKNNQPPTNPGSDVKSPGQVNPTTALETDINTPPGGSEDWTNKDVLKQGSVRQKLAAKRKVARVAGILKRAADSVSGVSNSAGSEPIKNPNASQSEEGVPSLPGEASKQESMINSLQAAMDYTKQQAKAVPKARMGEVLSEPAQKKSTDPVLQQNLAATAGAGVKISSATKMAAARALLHKIAEEGASEDASPEQKERAAKLQAALQAKQQEKSTSSDPEKEKDSGGCKTSSFPLGGGY